MNSRTDNTIKNIQYAILMQIVNILIRFIVRTTFIHSLGIAYLGLGNVFNNILNVLSLAELGIGTSIIYDMYKPIAENNTYLISQLLYFYRKIYAFIGLLIISIGLIIIPFLPYFLTDIYMFENVYLIYLLHVIYSSSSYFFAHYRSLFTAYQLERINSKNTTVIMLLRTAGEIFVLIVTRDYIYYIFVQVVITIWGNYLIMKKAKKMFPQIMQKVEKLDNIKVKNILHNALNMFSIKVGQTVLSSTDNILISAYISTIISGIYGNYNMITQLLLSTLFMLETAISASIGNLCTENKNNYSKKYYVFQRIRFGYSFLLGIMSTCLFILFNPFIELWLGQKYILNNMTVLIIVINFYLSGIRQPLEAFINADGLFRYFRIKPWIEIFINLTLSIIAVKLWGLIGIFIGTTISHILTTLWYDAYVVYKYSFSQKVRLYIALFLKNIFLTLISMGIVYFVKSHIIHVTFVSFMSLSFISFLVSFSIFTLVYFKTSEFQDIKLLLINRLFQHKEFKDERNIL